MKKVLLIARARTDRTKELAETFADRLRKYTEDDISIETCEISELFFELTPEKTSIYHPQKGFDLKDFDLVVLRHVGSKWVQAHAITVYCQSKSVRYTDTYLNRPLLDNKLSTQFQLWSEGITRWPHTMYGPAEELARRLPELGEKAVLKDNEGSKGRLNFVVSSPEQILELTAEYPDKSFVLQEFIPNDSDLRVLVFNDKPVMAIRRSGNSDSHLNNTSQGGSAEIIPLEELDSAILDISVKAAQHSKLQVAGVDVVLNSQTGEMYLLEVNNAPQISSGSYLEEKAELYAGFIKDMLAA